MARFTLLFVIFMGFFVASNLQAAEVVVGNIHDNWSQTRVRITSPDPDLIVVVQQVTFWEQGVLWSSCAVLGSSGINSIPRGQMVDVIPSGSQWISIGSELVAVYNVTDSDDRHHVFFSCTDGVVYAREEEVFSMAGFMLLLEIKAGVQASTQYVLDALNGAVPLAKPTVTVRSTSWGSVKNHATSVEEEQLRIMELFK